MNAPKPRYCADRLCHNPVDQHVTRPRDQRSASPPTCGARENAEAGSEPPGQAEAESAAAPNGGQAQADLKARLDTSSTRLCLSSLDHAQPHQSRRHVGRLRAGGLKIREVRLALRHVLAFRPRVPLIEPRAIEGDASQHVLQRGLWAQPSGQPGEPVAARTVRTVRAGHADDDIRIGCQAGHLRPARRSHAAAPARWPREAQPLRSPAR